MARKRFKVVKPAQEQKSARSANAGATRLTWAGRVCVFGAAGIAAYLLWYSITKQPMAGCGPGSACDRVMGSPWAYWLEIPVSAPALAAYATLLISSFLATGTRRQAQAVRAWRMLLVAGAAVIAAGIWFTALQVLVLHSICKFCTCAHLLGIAGVALLFIDAPYFSMQRRKTGDSSGLGWRTAVVPILAGLLAFTVIPAVQKLVPRNLNVVRIHQGAFGFDLREVPLLGSPDAAQFVVTLFDYTCPSCQEMHRHLFAAREKMSNSFSVVTLPLPLDPKCNSKITRAKPIHMEACDYARTGLAVRRASADAYEKYDHWFFEHTATPALAEARLQAIALIGQAAFDANLKDPWIDKIIQTSVSIYSKNEQVIHSLALPQLIIGDAVIAGPIHAVDQLVQVLSTNLAKVSLQR